MVYSYVINTNNNRDYRPVNSKCTAESPRCVFGVSDPLDDDGTNYDIDISGLEYNSCDKDFIWKDHDVFMNFPFCRINLRKT